MGVYSIQVYMCCVSTFYRVLKENRQVKERRRLATHPPRARPELVATGPGQLYWWGITKLAGPVKGRYYDAYVMIDIFPAKLLALVPGPTNRAYLRKR